MANAKISQLTAASTPLAGTEVLPIVQSGSTVKVAVNDLTAGKAVGTGNLTVTGTAAVSGNVAVNTDKFTVTAASGNTAVAGTLAVTGHVTVEGITSTGATGSGKFVFDTSPTLVTPTIGVATATSVNKMAITAPASGSTLAVADGKTFTVSNTLTLTGTDSSSVAFGTGGTVAYTSNKLSAFAATTSAELAGVISNETGSGSLVFGTGPTISAPVLTLKSYTFTQLSALTPTAGDVAMVTAADSGLAWGATVTGAGSADTTYQVWYNGSNWTVVGK